MVCIFRSRRDVVYMRVPTQYILSVVENISAGGYFVQDITSTSSGLGAMRLRTVVVL